MVPRSADAQPLVARRHIAAQSDAGAGTVYLGVLKAPAGIDTRDLPLDARLGVFHGFREKYLGAYLDEFVFRWDRRHSYRSAFDRLVGMGVAVADTRRHHGCSGLTSAI